MLKAGFIKIVRGAAVAAGLCVLVACGDKGDHFGEFRPTDSKVVSVAKIAMALSTAPNPAAAGTFGLTVTAYDDHGNAIPAGENFTHPIAISSNATCMTSLTLNLTGANATPSISITNAGTPVYVVYSPPPPGSTACVGAYPIVLTATDQDAATPGNFTFIGAATVKQINLSWPAPAGPPAETSGTYALKVTAIDSNGAVVPPGNEFVHAVLFTNSGACALTFGFSPNGTGSTTTLSLWDSTTQVYVTYLKPPPNSPCQPAPYTIEATDVDAASGATITF